ncbi:MAG: CoA-binding protein [Rhodothermales bacterium]|nr:CoA-binding protein [Rhodothermales bacterium]
MDIAELLRRTRTIAVVGLSPRSTRTSYKIAVYLQEAGYTIVPVNPHRDELLGEQAYPSLLDIPDSISLDLVDVFRRPEFMEGVVREAIARRDRSGNNPVIWTQIGVSSFEAEELANEAGIPYIRNRCTLVEHSRLLT